MENHNQTDKTPKAAKPFLSVGPTLHYSHQNVQRCWLLALVVYTLTCCFWSKVLTGVLIGFHPAAMNDSHNWGVGHYVISGLSIFEYPWQILVLSLLMGIIFITPLLISQLMSFKHSLIYLVVLLIVTNMPILVFSLLISCIAVACRPLRFRSRFISIVLCTVPQLIYWGYFGSARGVEPIKWGFSYTPWIGAWLIGLSIAGLVLGIGHFTRYRPGLVWLTALVFLALAFIHFHFKIGFSELDYQLYVARYNPQQNPQFHDKHITEALDQTITDPAVQKYLAGFFYPSEPIALREELKRELRSSLRDNRWPSWWFSVPDELDYQQTKSFLLNQYHQFIRKRPRSQRMPIALFYKAILSELQPDLNMLMRKEILHFYSDYPFSWSRETWFRLYREFPQSPESIEARWRVAMHWSGQGRFDEAQKLLREAEQMIPHFRTILTKTKEPTDSVFGVFEPPERSVLTGFMLDEIARKIFRLRELISPENRNGKMDNVSRLQRFVMLNPHVPEYASQLNELLQQMKKNDPLYDNVLLAKAKLIPDEQLRAVRLTEIHNAYQGRDGAVETLYDLGLLKIRLWQQQPDDNPQLRNQSLIETRSVLTTFLSLYPDSFYCEQVKKNLDNLPEAS